MTFPNKQIKPNIFDCNACKTRCDGITVPKFDFEKDVRFSENIENEVINEINKQYPNLYAIKTDKSGYPDIEITDRSGNGKPLLFVEIKVQARTFMSIARLLPNSGLFPSETLALNLSDLERYFTINDKEQIPVYIVWCLMHRPCIVGNNATNKLFFHQELTILRQIRNNDKTDSRRFRRASGTGDVVDGVHKGVVVNYHFSINELIKGLPQLTFLR